VTRCHHLFDSLQSAASLVVIQRGYKRQFVNLERWATTYRCTPEAVEEALKIAENGTRKLPEEVAVASSIPTTEEAEE
jgi:hypothetical protein